MYCKCRLTTKGKPAVARGVAERYIRQSANAGWRALPQRLCGRT